MLGPSAEESEMLVMEHLHYLERLAKFSLDLNMYNIPIVQETFQKLVSITGTRRFLQRAEAFERFLSMLSRRTLNSNYYLNRQYYEDVNTYNSNIYGNVNYDQDFARRVQAVNTENAYYRDYNRRILNNENMLSMNNMNRYYRQPYFNQRDISPNNNLDDIEEEEEEEEIEVEVEENIEEIDQDENIEQEENNNNLSFNSENSLPTTSSLREEYSIYAPSAHYRRHRSRAPSYESYLTRIRHPNYQRVQSTLPETSNSATHTTNNSDTKINDNIYPENNSETNNTISTIRTFNNPNNISLNTTITNTNTTTTTTTNITNTNDNNNNNNNNHINNLENIHHDSTNESLQLKYNTPSYRNINMKIYEDLNILTPPATEDEINIKEEKDTENENINVNTNQDININNTESQTIIIIPTVELGSIDQKIYSNIPKDNNFDSDDSSNNNTINKKSENSLNIKAEDYQIESIYKKGISII
ncbi:hypothetical protein PIROE2DRAFT_56722 [Piromyces sp. E2]|nr:hypothetical protein PIROE2DRAFT_56722 [Piromyces sp. E2]|eukprot:OUM70700.1 hypothetical protein PIROE2DRAFT_56722 [Piromyces sp. E2]